MAFEFKLPDVGEGLHEAEVLRWLVAVGDQLTEDQPMVEIQTDKAVVEIASPIAGRVAALHAAEGDLAQVGSTIITIEPADGPKDADAAHGAAGDAADEAAGATAAGKRAQSATPSASTPPASQPPGQTHQPSRRVLAAPSTRRLARQLGVDLNQVTGSGPAGRILDQDVQQFAAATHGETASEATETSQRPPMGARPLTTGRSAHTADPADVASEERVPLRGLRRQIAEQMVLSKTTIPHATHMDEVDVTELVRVRQEALPLAQEQGINLTYLPFIIKAVTAGLRQFPELNASLDDDANEIVLKHYYNIGIATDTDDGLMVPVIKQADQKSIFALAAELQRLADAARQRAIALEDLRGSTFSITNVGPLGGVYATPVINAPEAAILAVHRITQRPVVYKGEIVPRDMLTLSLAFDHRIADGASAVRFLNKVMSYLAQPSLLFMELI